MTKPSPERARLREILRGWLAAAASHGDGLRAGLGALVPEAPLELRIVGRVLLHAAVVGAAAGLVGAGFFAALEVVQRLLLEGLAGFAPLRAHGEPLSSGGPPPVFRPWMLALLPALGGLASGLLTSRLAPEAAGGGGDATIEAYHRGGLVRWRVIPVKGAAAVAALSSGGSGARGPRCRSALRSERSWGGCCRRAAPSAGSSSWRGIASSPAPSPRLRSSPLAGRSTGRGRRP